MQGRATARRGAELARDPLHLIRVGRQLHGALRERYTGVSLTPAQLAAVLALAQVPDSDQRTIAELAALDESTVGQVVRRLIARGMVTTRSDPADGRRRVLRISDNALERARADGEAMLFADRTVLAPLHTDEQLALIDDMRRIAYHFRPDAAHPDAASIEDLTGGVIPVAATSRAFGRLVRICQQYGAALWREELGETISPVAHSTLGSLVACGELAHGDLGELMSLDKASTAGLLRRLQEHGLVHSAASAQDRRQRIVAVSDAGAELVAATAGGAAAVSDRVIAPVPGTGPARFLHLLREVTVDHPDAVRTRGHVLTPASSSRRRR